MSNRVIIEDISAALLSRNFQTITLWNRLEGRPRKDDFDRALKAEIRDPLWMLTRQWQMGEFLGDDAGSPVFAKLHLATTRLNKYQAADHEVQAFDNQVPLEGTVEQRPLPFTQKENPFSINLRVSMGRYWTRLLKKKLAYQTTFYRENYGFEAPEDNSDPEMAEILAHPEAWQKLAALSGRAVDGYALYQHIINGGVAADGLVSPHNAEINVLGGEFVTWVEKLFLVPDKPEENAWDPSRLEYQFSCSAPSEGKEKVYEAEEYYTGKLDWFSLSINDKKASLGEPDGGADTGVEDTQTL
ncbi:MAG: hypothetical protein KDD63_00290, partial [Bacteroidetes bacterium]|nr:hypothetical protein [Bacteroidota bacterium]